MSEQSSRFSSAADRLTVQNAHTQHRCQHAADSRVDVGRCTPSLSLSAPTRPARHGTWRIRERRRLHSGSRRRIPITEDWNDITFFAVVTTANQLRDSYSRQVRNQSSHEKAARTHTRNFAKECQEAREWNREGTGRWACKGSMVEPVLTPRRAYEPRRWSTSSLMDPEAPISHTSPISGPSSDS